MTTTSVVVCTYDQRRRSDLEAALDSLRDQTTPPCEVIVVVDHNPELAAELGRRGGRERIMESTGPRGLSGARNTGVTAAIGDIVAFLDDDATAGSNWVERLSAPYVDATVIGVGGRVVPAFDVARPAWFPPEFDWVFGCTYAGHPESPTTIRNPIGANMSFRRPVFDGIDGFCEAVGRTAATPAGCEETELSIRAARATGGRIVYAPDAVVAHRVPKDRLTFRYFLRRCLAEGRSKRFVAALVGRDAALASEIAHVRRALPRAFVRAVSAGSIAQAAAIAAGAMTAAIGYLVPRPAVAVPEPLERLDPAEPATIVIATRDRPEQLGRCLDSVLIQDHPRFDIVVVDNAPSSDATESLVETYALEHPGRVRYVREDRAGLAHAHNRGLEIVHTSVVAFTDDDVVADPSWLRHLTAAFSAGPNVACVTGLIEPLELETQAQKWLDQYAAFGKGAERRVFGGADREDDPLFPYRAGSYGSGANMAFRTDVLRRLGGFDGALGAGTLAMGGDDLAAFVEVLDAGYQLVYEPAAIVQHEHRRDYAALRRQAFSYGAGLSAYVASVVAHRPGRAASVAWRFPAAARHALHPASEKNARLSSDYPSELRWLELRGMLVGPLYYVRSRRASSAA